MEKKNPYEIPERPGYWACPNCGSHHANKLTICGCGFDRLSAQQPDSNPAKDNQNRQR